MHRIPLLVRRGGCAVNKKSRSHLIPRRWGGRAHTTFQNAFRSQPCERPPRPLHKRRLRGILIDVASTPPQEEGNCSEAVTVLANPCIQKRSLRFANADSIAFDAVCPRPQIEASRIAWPISLSRANSSARVPIVRPVFNRPSNSSW